ncbi:MAG TPA: YetF domain-containing protein, partial [Bryobacteraceae bacterium]|nr:YetF domain-containing protein [Bryobacteraceae bacterium]
TWKQRSELVERLVDGTPILVYADGRWIEESMDMVRVQREDVRASARGEGIDDFEKVRYAIVERNGSISIIKK